MVDQAFALWLPVAYELGIPDPMFMNPDRRARLADRLRECNGIDGWQIALDQLRHADWLFDDGKPKRWLNLYTITKPETFTGLMEGRYVEHHDTQSRAAVSGTPTVSDGVTATFARRYPEPG